MGRSEMDPTLVSFVESLVYFAILAFVVLAALAQLGIQTTSFIAVIGAAGLAVGLALQGSLANFAAGVLLLIFRPFKVGDYIEGAGVAGVVEEIHIFTTLLGTPDNKAIIIPNSKLTGDNITNYTRKDKRRIDLVFACRPGNDIDKVKRAISEVLGDDAADPEGSSSHRRRPGRRGGRPRVRRPPVGQDGGVLERLFRHQREHEKAVRRRGDPGPRAAAGSPPAPGLKGGPREKYGRGSVRGPACGILKGRRFPMAKYVDGYVLPVPKKKLAAYRRLASMAGKIWIEHGALEFMECVGDDLGVKMGVPFPRRSRSSSARP